MLGWDLNCRRLPRTASLSRGDELGWSKDQHGKWHLALFVPQGRVADVGDERTPERTGRDCQGP